MMQFQILLPPVTKKNSQRIFVNRKTGKPFIVPSEKFKEYETAAEWFVRSAMNRTSQNFPIDFPVNIQCLFYMPTRRRCDLTNLLEAADDIMVHCGLLSDDSFHIIRSHDGSRVLFDKENPRTEITITEAEL